MRHWPAPEGIPLQLFALMWSRADVIGLFSNNVVSFSRNVVLSDASFSLNLVLKPRMLSVRAVYVLRSYEADVVKPLMYFFWCSGYLGFLLTVYSLVVDILKHNSRQCSSGCCCPSAHVISLQLPARWPERFPTPPSPRP
jgi:hypothetical protein